MSNFVSDVIDGTALLTDIDDQIDDWHVNAELQGVELHDHLGMTWDEYRLWVEQPLSLRFIVRAHQEQRPLNTVLMSSQDLALAARTEEAAAAHKVRLWLIERGRLTSDSGERQQLMAQPWPLSESDLPPERRIAELVSRRHKLSIPVDIEALTARYAQVEYHDWPFACDGLAALTMCNPPKIFIKREQDPRRTAFTIAHELGHVMIGWHVGAAPCDIFSNEGPTTSPEEREANRFAGSILLPRHAAAGVVALGGIKGLFDALETCGMSAEACAIEMSSILLPGFVMFVGQRSYVSSGTTPRETRSEARKHALAQGKVQIGSKSLSWYQLTEAPPPVTIVTDSRKPTELLRAAIAFETGDPAEAQALLMRINGIVGAATTTDRTADESAIYSIMKYRVSTHRDIPPTIVDSGEFDQYLYLKARARAAKLTKQ